MSAFRITEIEVDILAMYLDAALTAAKSADAAAKLGEDSHATFCLKEARRLIKRVASRDPNEPGLAGI